jgi:hypothetical protein
MSCIPSMTTTTAECALCGTGPSSLWYRLERWRFGYFRIGAGVAIRLVLVPRIYAILPYDIHESK